MGEVWYAEGTLMFDLIDYLTIRPSGAEVAAIPNGLVDEMLAEGSRRIQRAPLVEALLYTMCLRVG